jgi:hypothetical protein
MPLNETTITDAVTNIAESYESALDSLMNEAREQPVLDSAGNQVIDPDTNQPQMRANMDLSNAIIKTTTVQIKQSLLELFTGGVKNLTDHLKSLARKIN